MLWTTFFPNKRTKKRTNGGARASRAPPFVCCFSRVENMCWSQLFAFCILGRRNIAFGAIFAHPICPDPICFFPIHSTKHRSNQSPKSHFRQRRYQNIIPRSWIVSIRYVFFIFYYKSNRLYIVLHIFYSIIKII